MSRAILYMLLLTLSFAACNSLENEPTTEAENTTKPTVKGNTPAATKALPLTERQKLTYEGLGVDVTKGVPTGLPVGTNAPVFKQKDQNGYEIFLPDMYKDGAVVVLFYRGQWCPVCDKHLSNLQDSIALIKDTGAEVVIITPETFENVKKTLDNTGIDAHIISDNSGLLMDAFKVSFFVNNSYQEKIRTKLATDIATNNGNKVAKLPVPATYIINKNGRITWRHFNIDYHDRATAFDMLQALSVN